MQVALETESPSRTPGGVAEVRRLPEALRAVADTGVATLDALQDAFSRWPATRFRIALQGTAGDGKGATFGALSSGQFGGRSACAAKARSRCCPEPDRGAVRAGRLETALDEVAATLPDGAQAETGR